MKNLILLLFTSIHLAANTWLANPESFTGKEVTIEIAGAVRADEKFYPTKEGFVAFKIKPWYDYKKADQALEKHDPFSGKKFDSIDYLIEHPISTALYVSDNKVKEFIRDYIPTKESREVSLYSRPGTNRFKDPAKDYDPFKGQPPIADYEFSWKEPKTLKVILWKIEDLYVFVYR